MKRNGMVRRGLALGMALLMTAGLLPAGFAQPAEADGLAPKAIMDYYDKLASYQTLDTVVIYAGLRDMDGDRMPELIVVSADYYDDVHPMGEHGYANALVEIWTMRDGALVRSNSRQCEANKDCGMGYASRDGKLYVAAYTHYYSWGDVFFDCNTYIGMDGYVEELTLHEERTDFFDEYGDSVMDGDYSRCVNGVETGLTKDEYERYLEDFSGTGEWIAGSWWCWYDGYANDGSFYDAQQQLADRMSVFAVQPPSSGGFGAYSITGLDYGGSFTVFFDRAKVEKQTVQMSHADMEGYVDPNFEAKQVTLVTLHPDCGIRVERRTNFLSTINGVDTGDAEGLHVVGGDFGGIDSSGRYVWGATGAVDYVLRAGRAGDGIGASDFISPAAADADGDRYIVIVGDASAVFGYRQPQVDGTEEPGLAREMAKLISDRLGGEVSGIYRLADGIYYILAAVGDRVKGVLVKGSRQSGRVVWAVAGTDDEPLEPDALDALAAQVQSTPNLAPDFTRLQNSPGIQTVKDYLRDLLENMDGITPNDPAKGELAAFLESAVASVSAASVSGKGNQVTVPAGLAADLARKAQRAKEELEDILFDNQVSLNKPVTVLLRILWQDMDAGAPCQVTLDGELADALGDSTLQLLLGDRRYYIQLSGSRLKELTDRLGALSVQLSRNEEGAFAVSFLDGKAGLIEKLPAAVTLALPSGGPLSTVIASYAGGSENWGGQYDQANGAITFDAVYSGQYQVLENDLDIADAAGLPEETRTAISFLVSRGYLNLEDGLFRPDAPLTRYEFTEALVGMFFALDRSLTTRFRDVPQDSPYYAYVASAEARNIVKGMTGDTFGGEQNITAEQLLALAARTLMDQKGSIEPADPAEYLNACSDGGQVSDWARAQVALAIREGLADRGTALDPQGEITRAQAAVGLYRLFLRLYEVRPVALELPPVTEEPGGGERTIPPAAMAAAAGIAAAAGVGGAALILKKKKRYSQRS